MDNYFAKQLRNNATRDASENKDVNQNKQVSTFSICLISQFNSKV